MGGQRGNPWYGWWNESEDDGYHNLYPHPTPTLDKKREEEYKKKYENQGDWVIIQPAKPKGEK